MLQILISACLIGENCKWDGTNNRNQDVLDFMKKMEGKDASDLDAARPGRPLPLRWSW